MQQDNYGSVIFPHTHKKKRKKKKQKQVQKNKLNRYYSYS